MAKEDINIGVNIFIVDEDRLLLGKRKDVPGDGQWGLPGGHLEKDECIREAAARELKEETNLEAESFELTNIIDQAHRPDDRHYIQFGLVAQHVTNELINNEPDKCSEFKWFKTNELPENIFFGHTEQIKAFVEGKHGLTEPYL